MLVTLAKWLIFSVLISLVPIAFSYQKIWVRSGNVPSLEQILSGGELFLLACALCASSVGGLIGSSRDRMLAKTAIGGISIIIVAAASMIFADVSAASTAGAGAGQLNYELNKSLITLLSIVYFACSLIVSGVGVILAEN